MYNIDKGGRIMNINDNALLRMKTTRFVLKDDLGYKFTEEEKSLYEEMSDSEKRMVRKNILANIKNKILSLDVLEEFLIELKNEEITRYMNNEGKESDVEEQILKVEELENKYSRMIINFAHGNVNSENLLGPNIHETYGIKEEKISFNK